MRHHAAKLILGLALTFCLGASASAQQKEWEKFAPSGGGFSVLMPGKPTANDQEVPTPNGKLINRMFLLDAGESAYLVAYMDFPEPVSDPARIKAMLDSARDQAIAGTRGRLKEEKEIKLGEHTGREWFVALPGGLLRARGYWVKQRVYQVVVLMPEGKDAASESAREATMARFLNSFALTPETPGAK